MGGCSADYCTNSSRKGFQMCSIPQKVKRRKIWLQNINRQDWVAGHKSQLCHYPSQVHFTEDMWKITKEGKRRLKSNAVPTIFHNRIISMSIDSEQMVTDVIVKQNEQCKENSDPQITLAVGSEVPVDSIIVSQSDRSILEEPNIYTIKEEVEEYKESNETHINIVVDSKAMVDSITGVHYKEIPKSDGCLEKSSHKDMPPKSQEYASKITRIYLFKKTLVSIG